MEVASYISVYVMNMEMSMKSTMAGHDCPYDSRVSVPLEASARHAGGLLLQYFDRLLLFNHFGSSVRVSKWSSGFKFNQSAFNFRYISPVSIDTEYGRPVTTTSNIPSLSTPLCHDRLSASTLQLAAHDRTRHQ
jgi:hypothetical protein